MPRSSFRSVFDWFRALGTNLYFWGGVALLLFIGFGAYVVVDAVIMPAYTRHDVSIRVPNVEKRPFEKAKSLLEKRDLRVERQVGRFNPNVERNEVVDQTPLPNSKVKPGRRVYLTVNAGEVPVVKIPDLNGMSVREAKNRVSSIGLKVETVRKDPVPSPYANTITKQDPAPGDSIKEGQSIDLWYSTGLGEEEVKVPNVVGYSVKRARDFLLQNKLRSVVVDTNLTQGSAPSQDLSPSETEIYVRRQRQAPDATVQAGTEIRLFTTPDETAAMERRDALEDSTTSSN